MVAVEGDAWSPNASAAVADEVLVVLAMSASPIGNATPIAIAIARAVIPAAAASDAWRHRSGCLGP